MGKGENAFSRSHNIFKGFFFQDCLKSGLYGKELSLTYYFFYQDFDSFKFLSIHRESKTISPFPKLIFKIELL